MEVEEIMLGIDWLTENYCKWHFVERQVEKKGLMIPLRNRRSLAGVLGLRKMSVYRQALRLMYP